jgi:cytoskeletal protein CcmA (bactofilin family)
MVSAVLLLTVTKLLFLRTARLGAAMKSRLLFTGAAAVVVLSCLSFVTVVDVEATTIQAADKVHISNLHRIDDDLYAFAQKITIDGLIEGDLIAGGQDVFTNGEVTESQDVFAYRLVHTGTVGNSLRAFCNTIEIDGRVGRSVLLFGNEILIGKGAVIERDVTAGCRSARIEGEVGGDVDISAEKIYLSGEIGGDVTLKAQKITITAPTVIKGSLTYTTEKELDLGPSSGVTVLGETQWRQPEQEAEEQEKEAGGIDLQDMVLQTSKLLAAFLFGVIVIYVFRRHAQESFNQLRTRFAVSAAAGFLSLFVLLLAIIILITSVIFILIGLALSSGSFAPLGALVLILSLLMVPITSFTTVAGAIVFYAGKILFALLVGYLVVRIFKKEPAVLGRGQLLLGLIILALLFAVPYVGFLIYLLVAIIGAGGIVLGIKKCRPATAPTTSDHSQPA